MRSAPLAWLLLAASACTHLPAVPAPGPAERVEAGATSLELRYGPADAEAAAQVRRLLPAAVLAAERWGPLGAGVVLTIHPTHGELESAAGRRGRPWMRAWARRDGVELQSPRTWSRGHASDEALGQVLAHELTHCVLFRSAARDGGGREIPLWFREGLSSVAAGERHARASAEALAAPEELLRSDSKLVYGTADRAFRYLLERHGEERARRLVAALGRGRPFPEAFRDVLGVTVGDFESDFRSRLSALAVRP